MEYRREIDGLRAIAVIPVIFFHAGISGFSGGFLGVDIFFVISGYLIGSIIMGQLAAGRFSLATFYERRARRILPALLVVVATCVPLAEWLMLPGQRKDFYESVVAVGLFGSNILFWTETGYFAAASELKPLLHTWSLAVEEQFYLFFPLMLMALWRWRGRAVPAAVMLLFVTSLALSEWMAAAMPGANFYLLPSRIWELMAGVMCALLQQRFGQWRSAPLGLAGLAAIIASLFLFSADTPFPSIMGLVPVGGVALVILFAAQGTAAARFLSLPPFVWVGLVSYSAYLWHQPLFAFMRLYALKPPPPSQLLALAALSLGLAAATYRYVEQPFRHQRKADWLPYAAPRLSLSRPAVLTGGVAVLAVMVIAGMVLRPVRTSDAKLLALQQTIAPSYGLSGSCGEGGLTQPECRTAAQPEILVWGDSHAAHSVPAILGDNPKAKLIQATFLGCPPLFDVRPLRRDKPAAWQEGCVAANENVKAYIEKHGKGLHVVIASPWIRNVDPREILQDGKGRRAGSPQLLRRHLRRTLRIIDQAGAVPVLLVSPPVAVFDPAQCAVKALATARSAAACDLSMNDVDKRWKDAASVLETFAGDVPLIRFADALCEQGHCYMTAEGKPLYRDFTHFSDFGAAKAGRALGLYRRIMQPVPAADQVAGLNKKEAAP